MEISENSKALFVQERKRITEKTGPGSKIAIGIAGH
jgi:hypothetical protein